MRALVCLVLTAWWSARASKYQEIWFKAMETRLHKTVQVLKGIKGIKQMGAAQPIFDLLQAERASEIGLSKNFRLQMIAIITLCKARLLNYQGHLSDAYNGRSLLFTQHASRNRSGVACRPLKSAIRSDPGRPHCVHGADTVPTCELGYTRWRRSRNAAHGSFRLLGTRSDVPQPAHLER